MGQFPVKQNNNMKSLNFDFDNLGGVQSLFAIPATSLQRIRTDYNTGLNYLELKNRDDIIELPHYANDTYSFAENHKKSDAGDAWEITIEGVAPKQCIANADLIEKLERGEWYVLALDNNGEAHWCGQEETMMLFSTSKNTGKSITERNEIAFSFSNIQTIPSVYISDVDLDS